LAKQAPRISRVSEIKEILKLLEGTDIEEIELEKGDLRIRIKKRGPAPAWFHQSPPPLISPASEEKPFTPLLTPPEKDLGPTGNLMTITSPMVGTFYRAPLPGAEPFVREGDIVDKGKVVCIIEAMKLMNEIESEVSGRIDSILVENVQPVEYGQPLFLIEPI